MIYIHWNREKRKKNQPGITSSLWTNRIAYLGLERVCVEKRHGTYVKYTFCILLHHLPLSINFEELPVNVQRGRVAIGGF